jgi:hypothetical protein
VARGSLTTEQWRMPTSPTCISKKAVTSGARGGSVGNQRGACHPQIRHVPDPLLESVSLVPLSYTVPWDGEWGGGRTIPEAPKHPLDTIQPPSWADHSVDQPVLMATLQVRVRGPF